MENKKEYTSELDFTKQIKNSNKFRQAAIHFIEHGVYTNAMYGSRDFKEYWDMETRRCLHGYEAPDGDYISGRNYFYLNFCPIIRNIEKEYIDRKGYTKRTIIRDRQFADFYDYDYYFFQAFDEAFEQDKHLLVLKTRGRGYSYKADALLLYNFFFLPESFSYAFAAAEEFLLKDGTLSKAWDIMDFINRNTAWTKKRIIDKPMHKKAGYKAMDEMGNPEERGFKSEIIGVAIGTDVNKGRGKRGKLIFFEEGGSFKNLESVWAIARPSVERSDGGAFGTMLIVATGGDIKGGFDGVSNMFYNPDAYNLLAFNNIWDDNADGQRCCFFCPAYTNIEAIDDEGKRTCMDEDGNTITHKSIEFIRNLRAKTIDKATSNELIDKYIAENPCTPQEAMLIVGGNIFPKKDLMEHLSRIRTNKVMQSCKHVGDLARTTNGQLVWKDRKYGDITKYKVTDDDDKSGATVIWEHPNLDAPRGMYIAACDPYDHDVAQTGSLGSTFIYKRFNTFETYNDVLVAEYTGRPATAEEYYENVRRLLEYYNAKMLYENERKGLHVYFTQKKCDHLLQDTPDILTDTISTAKMNRKKGIHMTKYIKEYGLGLIKEWLNEELTPGVKRLTTIMSEPLLEELIAYNDAGNFDRVISLLLILIYKEQLYNNSVKDRKDEDKSTKFFSTGFFSSASSELIHSDFIRINF
jgi:hypothetical protein